jgi:MoxR-like ATPase
MKKDDVRKQWERCRRALESLLVRTAYIWGPPGIGKTFAAFHFGRVERGYYSVTLTDETPAAELRGHWVFKGGDAIWFDGPFIRAMREGKRLVINEICNANADVLALLFPILESPETAQLTLPTGETVRPAPGFHVVVTDNNPPDQLPEPLQDRFVVLLHVTEPHPDALAGLPEHLREAAAATLQLTDNRRISARGWTNLAMLEGEFGLEEACLLAFGPARGQMVFDALSVFLATR